MSHNKKKRSLSSMYKDSNVNLNRYAPSPKKPRNNPLKVNKIFEHKQDQQAFNKIYSTLKSMNNLKEYPLQILLNISIFATGEIRNCDACLTKEILYLQHSKYKKNIYFQNFIPDLRGLEGMESLYIYCWDCFDPDNNTSFKKCLSCEHYYHLNQLRSDSVYVRDSGYICNDCIYGEYASQCKDCKECFTNSAEYGNITEQLICEVCGTFMCPSCLGEDKWDCINCEKRMCKSCREICYQCGYFYCIICGPEQCLCGPFPNK